MNQYTESNRDLMKNPNIVLLLYWKIEMLELTALNVLDHSRTSSKGRIQRDLILYFSHAFLLLFVSNFVNET